MPLLSRIGTVAALAGAFCLPAASYACGNFGADRAAVDKVQSSWGPAEAAAAHADYARALELLEATKQYLPSIQNVDTRRCVGEGADLRIASATAGKSYLSKHPGDASGARSAYHAAWMAFPLSHNCP
jgi:hypothetical protein